MGGRPRQVSACYTQAHSCEPVAFTPLCHSKALTQKLLNPDVSVLLNCKALRNASCTASKSGVSVSAFISSSACLSQYGAAEASTSSLVLTGSFIPLHQFVQLSIGNSATKGRGCCVSLLTFQGHVKTSEETESSNSSSKLLRVSLGVAETYIYIRNIFQIKVFA